MFKKYGLPAIITLVLGAINFYISVPAINIRSEEFWGFLAFLVVVYVVSMLIIRGTFKIREVFGKNFEIKSAKNFKKPAFLNTTFFKIAIAVVAVAVIAIFVSSSPVFRANKYKDMISVEERNFSEDIAEIPLSSIPVVDRDTASRLGSRTIGQVVELVSQFNVSEYYTQINYKEAPTRVSPLEYADILKWFVNKDEGIPYYVKIDMASQDTELVELEKGIRYSPSEYFGRDLLRHIRFKYPTKMFTEFSFEIDDNGNPFWVVSYYDYTIGFLGGKDIKGIILVDAVSGETKNYKVKDIPQWIDRVYDADLILEQADYWGSLQNGFINSVLAQKNVVITTDGYNYLAINDDVWLYTGITSVASDKSNIGFLLVNMRTKEARTYAINGAEEYSAMESAEGQIQEKNYSATFPILVNIQDTPSYFVSLKDDAGLVKAYSFVSVTDYQIVGVADTISGAEREYRRLLVNSGKVEDNPQDTVKEDLEISGKVVSVSNAVVGGNTVYYILLENDEKVYTAEITVNSKLPFLKVGDVLKAVAVADGDKYNITSID